MVVTGVTTSVHIARMETRTQITQGAYVPLGSQQHSSPNPHSVFTLVVPGKVGTRGLAAGGAARWAVGGPSSPASHARAPGPGSGHRRAPLFWLHTLCTPAPILGRQAHALWVWEGTWNLWFLFNAP